MNLTQFSTTMQEIMKNYTKEMSSFDSISTSSTGGTGSAPLFGGGSDVNGGDNYVAGKPIVTLENTLGEMVETGFMNEAEKAQILDHMKKMPGYDRDNAQAILLELDSLQDGHDLYSATQSKINNDPSLTENEKWLLLLELNDKREGLVDTYISDLTGGNSSKSPSVDAGSDGPKITDYADETRSESDGQNKSSNQFSATQEKVDSLKAFSISYVTTSETAQKINAIEDAFGKSEAFSFGDSQVIVNNLKNNPDAIPAVVDKIGNVENTLIELNELELRIANAVEQGYIGGQEGAQLTERAKDRANDVREALKTMSTDPVQGKADLDAALKKIDKLKTTAQERDVYKADVDLGQTIKRGFQSAFQAFGL